jgi:hypothetical protein
MSSTKKIAYRATVHIAVPGHTMWTSVHVITARGTRAAVTRSNGQVSENSFFFSFFSLPVLTVKTLLKFSN